MAVGGVNAGVCGHNRLAAETVVSGRPWTNESVLVQHPTPNKKLENRSRMDFIFQ